MCSRYHEVFVEMLRVTVQQVSAQVPRSVNQFYLSTFLISFFSLSSGTREFVVRERHVFTQSSRSRESHSWEGLTYPTGDTVQAAI